MTTALDRRLPGKVLAMLERLGRPATIQTVTTEGTYNRTTGQRTGKVVAAVAVKAAPLYQHKVEWDDVTRRQTARTLLAAHGATFTPQPGWVLTMDGQAWKVLEVVPYATGTLVAAWELMLEAGA